MYLKKPNPDVVLPENPDFSMRLWYVMEKQGWSILRLAQASGVTPATIHGYLNRRMSPRMDVFKKLCRTLKVSMDWMCGMEEEE